MLVSGFNTVISSDGWPSYDVKRSKYVVFQQQLVCSRGNESHHAFCNGADGTESHANTKSRRSLESSTENGAEILTRMMSSTWSFRRAGSSTLPYEHSIAGTAEDFASLLGFPAAFGPTVIRCAVPASRNPMLIPEQELWYHMLRY